MMNQPDSISVVIPVKNEAAKIAACLDGILQQTVQVREIIVVDSGSTDGTLEILARYPEVRTIRIDPADFNHGETRNLGVRAATGDWVVMTVGDARAASTMWIEHLLEGVVDDQVVAVCGSQAVPHERDKNPVEWFRPVTAPRLKRVEFASAREFDELSPAEKLEACGWDDVTSLYRHDVLRSIPFQRTVYGEDALWAKDALRAGRALVYNPAALVYHYHTETPDFSFRRTLSTMYLRFRAFGYLHHEPGLAVPMLRSVRTLMRESAITWQERFYWARYIWRNQLAIRSAVRQFRTAVAAGGSNLDALHERLCGKVPVPEKFPILPFPQR
jgi:rhamnosyltransferase